MADSYWLQKAADTAANRNHWRGVGYLELEVPVIRQLGLVCALACVALVAGCGEKDEPAPTAGPAAAVTAAAPAKPANRVLSIPTQGNPIVWVRQDREVDLYDRPGGEVIQTVGRETEWGSPTVFAVDRSRDEWAGVPTAFLENGRLAWMRLDAKRLRAGAVEWEIEIDLSDYRADLILGDEVVRSFTVSIGMPGAETPTGRFAVTDTFRGGLHPAYGCCAVALTARQIRLPSGWLGGDRIAIHATSGPLGAAVSHGCVRAADEHVNELVNKVPLGTPVTIRQ